MAQLTLEDFADKVGKTFRLVVDDENTIDAELIEAVAVGGTQAAGRQQFSIVFEMSRNVEPQQRTYRVEQDDLGDMDLFLVPIFGDDEVLRFEAVFT